MNELNARYIKEVTCIHDALTLLVEMWCLPLVWSWSIDMLLLTTLDPISQRVYPCMTWFDLVEGQEWNMGYWILALKVFLA